MVHPGRRPSAFSLIELVLVIAIIAIVAAIAIRRFSSASSRSAEAAVQANIAVVEKAIEFYRAEHAGRSPAAGASGALSTSGQDFASRLSGKTGVNGALDPDGLLGPYVRTFPVNPLNALRTVRIGDPAAGAGTHGWHFDPDSGSFSSDAVDDTAGAATADPVDPVDEGMTGMMG